MIKSLSIKNIATFNNNGITINDLKSINIIYGANGSGKSTIGKVIADINSYKQSSISWKNDRPIKVLAYNKYFCKNNFLEQMPGVFTLGETGTAAIIELEQKQAKLQEIISKGQFYKSEIEKQTTAINNETKIFYASAWIDIFKKYEQWFSKTAIGARTKDQFIEKLMTAYQQNHSKPLPISELKNKASVLFAKQALRIEPYTLINNPILSSIETDSIWTKNIVGKQDIDIAGLISKLNNSDWVSKGAEYITNESNICPFCQQHTITPVFRTKISEFFDETYKRNVNKVNTRYSEYKNAVEILTRSLEDFIISQKAQEKPFFDCTNLDSILYALKATFSKNLELISLKQKEPSHVITLTDTTDIIGMFNAELIKANMSIKAHNKLVDNFASERSSLIDEIWKFFAAEYDTTITRHILAVNDKEHIIKNLTRQREETVENYRKIKSEIIHIENSITSVTPTINAINRLLKKYGYTNFQIREIKENKNHYQIIRENGEPVKDTLSEGETTFISFLYYLQVAKGSYQPHDITTDKVLIIDDPVSNLDSNALFIVSSLLRDIFMDIHKGKGAVKQIILLTHNMYFHKGIAFSDKTCKWKDDVKYWVLRKQDNISSIQDFGNQNPIRSSYELMWAELRNKSQNSFIVIQNTMRRILENYFLHLGGKSPDEILEKFENYKDHIICQSLLNWGNDDSYSLSDDPFVEMSNEQLDQYMKVFKDIFYNMNQDAHYEMMMQMKEDSNHE